MVAVGGTTLNTRDQHAARLDASRCGAAPAAGCSSDETKPAWQSGISALHASAPTSDVSAVADPTTGVAVYQTYGGSGWACTAARAHRRRIIASVYALAGTPGAGDRPASYPYAHTGQPVRRHDRHRTARARRPSCARAAPAGTARPVSARPNGTAGVHGRWRRGGNTVTVTNPGSQTGTVGTASQPADLTPRDSAPASPDLQRDRPADRAVDQLLVRADLRHAVDRGHVLQVTVTATDTTQASGQASFTWTIGGPVAVAARARSCVNPGFESGSTALDGDQRRDQHRRRALAHRRRLRLAGRVRHDAHRHAVADGVPSRPAARPTLTYYLYIPAVRDTTTAYDKLTLAANGTTVQSFSNINKGTGYVQRSVNLSAYRGPDRDAEVDGYRGLVAGHVVLHRRHGAQPQLATPN